MNASRVSLVTLLIGGTALIGLGYSYGAMRRAWADWRDTRAKLPGLRKGFFSLLWTLFKVAAVVTIGVAVVVAWNVRDQ